MKRKEEKSLTIRENEKQKLVKSETQKSDYFSSRSIYK